ncbi:22.0 kDa heat shock protein [Acorus gramineus]|uniref:22.0 kDa heat shock protein n=1 Tax=Acorus gramineus TaxID=55184 RepID=A0AAV9AGT0_ACOGR|nr:22.0 kDa heat shock protein [Acorus gramineus]
MSRAWFKNDELDIKISDDGNTITVSGGRVFDDAVAVAGDLTVRREMRIGRFRKEFRIPDGVDLDRIDADLDEDHGVLYVYLPKAAAAIAAVEEVPCVGVLPEIGAEKPYSVADRLEEAKAIAPDSNQASSIEAEETDRDRDREGSRSEEVDEGRGDLDRPMEDGGESRGDAVAEAAEGEEERRRSMVRGGAVEEVPCVGVLPEIGAEKPYSVADRLEEAKAIAPDSNQASSIEAEETDRDREGPRSEEVDEGRGDLDRPMEDGGESRGDAVAEAAEGEEERRRSMVRGGVGLLARSAFILSLVVIAFRLMRNKRRGS